MTVTLELPDTMENGLIGFTLLETGLFYSVKKTYSGVLNLSDGHCFSIDDDDGILDIRAIKEADNDSL